MNQSKSRGQIVRRGPSSFTVRVYLGRDAQGKRQYFNETVRGTREDAERVLTAKLHDTDTGRLVMTPRVNVSEFLAQWLDAIAGSVEPRTHLGYEGYTRTIGKYLGNVPLASLQPLRIQSAYAAMTKDGLGPRSVRHAHAVLRASLRWGQKMRLLGTVATDGVTLPRLQHDKSKKVSFTPDEAKRLLETAEAAGDNLVALWRILLECGLRPSEARALRWSDLMTVEGLDVVRVERAVQLVGQSPRREEIRNPKTDASKRTLPLTRSAVAALEAHRKAQVALMLAQGAAYERQDLIFATRTGGLLSQEFLLKRWRVACVRAGLPPLKVYAARHTAATLLLEAGVPIRVVQEVLGHSSITLTANTYSHVSLGMTKSAAEAMETTLRSRVAIV